MKSLWTEWIERVDSPGADPKELRAFFKKNRHALLEELQVMKAKRKERFRISPVGRLVGWLVGRLLRKR